MQKHIEAMLTIAHTLLKSHPHLSEHTGKVNAKGDHSIGMDVKIEEAFIEYLSKEKLPVTVFSEEEGIIQLHNKPEYLVVFDPLDGSTNYRIGKGLLPYGTLIAIYDGTTPFLKNIITAGALEYTHDLYFLYANGNTYDQSNRKLTLETNWPVHKSTPVYLDTYYKKGYELYRSLPERVFVRNTGSTIGNLSYVLSDVAAAVGGVSMRAEEIGSVYALITGASGIVTDHEGNDLGERIFSSEVTYPILGGNGEVTKGLVELLKAD